LKRKRFLDNFVSFAGKWRRLSKPSPKKNYVGQIRLDVSVVSWHKQNPHNCISRFGVLPGYRESVSTASSLDSKVSAQDKKDDFVGLCTPFS